MDLLIILSIFGALGFGVTVDAVDRTLNATINPGCTLSPCRFGVEPPFEDNLLYIQSMDISNNITNGKNYQLYWSTIGAPTVIISQVSPLAPEHDLDFMNFLEDRKPSLPFLHLHATRYAGIGFAKLIEYNDVNNTGELTDANHETRLYYLDQDFVKWYNVTLIESGENLLGNFTGQITRENLQFNITIQMRVHVGEGRAAENPRMLFTPATVTVRVILDHVPIHFNRSRFALELMFASNDSTMAEATRSQDKSISDEYSPGTFIVERVGGADTFVQWRPIVYTKISPGVSDSTRSHTGRLLNITNLVDWGNTTDWGMPYSLLQGIQGIQGPGTSLVRFNVSFGLTDDDYYNSTAYQEWTCEIGVGAPPVDVVSKNVRMIIAVGFGIPAALIVIGGAYVAYLKLKKRRESRLVISETTTTTTNYQTLGPE